MRRLFLLLLCLLSLPTVAQEDYAMPELPDEPIFADERLISIRHNFIQWVDNDTLVFAPYQNEHYRDEELDLGYQYQLSTGSLNRLDFAPFFAEWSAEKREFFQTGNYRVHRPVFSDERGRIPVIYQSSVKMVCGGECLGTVIMTGSYEDANSTSYNEDFYTPLPMPAQTDLEVYWSRNLQAAVFEMSSNYAGPRSLFYLELDIESRHRLAYRIETDFEFYSGRVLGLSPDGRHVILESDERQVAPEGSVYDWVTVPFLIIWTAPYHDEHCQCTYDAEIRRIDGEIADIPNQQKNFAGISFLDEDTLLYTSTEGLMRYSMSTGERSLVNPLFNSYWMETAVFSPDNRHIAVVTAQGLYVLPTGLTNP
jgi:hypothetical protein